jgi:hypothetical protein
VECHRFLYHLLSIIFFCIEEVKYQISKHCCQLHVLFV